MNVVMIECLSEVISPSWIFVSGSVVCGPILTKLGFLESWEANLFKFHGFKTLGSLWRS